jgi:hypothetical protein
VVTPLHNQAKQARLACRVYKLSRSYVVRGLCIHMAILQCLLHISRKPVILFPHRKKPRLPGIRRKVPTALHSIGTAHAAPEVPELFYAYAGSCRPVVLSAGRGPGVVPAYVYPAVCMPAVYGSGSSPGVRPAPTTAPTNLPANQTHGAGRPAGRSDLRRRMQPVP